MGWGDITSQTNQLDPFCERHLCLARTGDGAIGPSRSGSSAAAIIGGSTNGGNLGIFHVNQRLPSCVATRTTSLGSLVVRRNVEGDKQHKIGSDDDHSRESSKFLSGAFASVRHGGEVGACEVSVRGEVNEAYTVG